nr:hypothetical protein [uncultured Carboxylicivirga sp.]
MDALELKMIEGGIIWWVLGGLAWDFLNDPEGCAEDFMYGWDKARS